MLFIRYYPKSFQGIPTCAIINEMTDHWANDKVIAIWMFQLREIDLAMCEDDPLRLKTLFVDPIIGLHEIKAKNKWLLQNQLIV